MDIASRIPDGPPLPPGVQRSAGIDVLRGLCALFVVLHHIHLRFELNDFPVTSLLPKSVGRVVFWSGYLAVITFFVISGFLITTLSVRRWKSLSRMDVGAFYRLRFARIAPCLLLLVTVASLLHLFQVEGFVIDPDRSSLGRAVLAALTFHVNWLEGHHGYLPGCWDILWSLSVEEVFYLLFPIVCLLCRDERWLLVPLFTLIFAGPFNRMALAGQDPWQDYAYLSCADGIAIGCIAALVAGRVRFEAETLRLMRVVGLFAVLLIVAFRGTPPVRVLYDEGLGISVQEVGVALLLVVISQGSSLDRLARWTGVIRAIGRGSYEIYLTHMLVILGLMPVIKSLSPRGPMIVAWYATLLTLSVLLGLAVYAWYSEPLNERLRRG
jgi:peptidoglycan/LPS O-acetylase OafA/YrhL